MITVLALVAAMQTAWTVLTPAYTVGDTVVLERFVPLPSPAVRLRVSPLERSEDLEPMRPPLVDYMADGARIRYVVAAFAPHEFTVTLPDFDLVFPDGRVEAVPGGGAVLTPRAVLPAAPADSLPAPRWSQAPIARRNVRYEPVLFLGGLALAGVLIWGVMRRLVRPRPPWGPETVTEAEAPIMDWVSAGEPRAVAALQSARLRRQIAGYVPAAREALSRPECMTVLEDERPEWPLVELHEALAGLDRASFAPAVPSDVLVLVDDVMDVMKALEAAETADAAESAEVPETVESESTLP